MFDKVVTALHYAVESDSDTAVKALLDPLDKKAGDEVKTDADHPPVAATP